MLGHVGIPGPAPFIAMGLFFGGVGAAVGAYIFFSRRAGLARRAIGVGLGVVAVGCFGLATVLLLVIHDSPLLSRPSTRARLSPRAGEVIHGDSAAVQVAIRLDGGRIVPVSSLHLIPDAGHIHLYLDGSLASMTGLDARITAPLGHHTLRAEFVAVDHGPFRPRVLSAVSFEVMP